MKTETHFQNESFHFEDIVRRNFYFLETEENIIFQKVEVLHEKSPLDRTLSCRYASNDFRFEIGWNQVEFFLGAMGRFKQLDLELNEKSIYIEPFIEFLTKGEVLPRIPFVRINMNIGQLENLMKERRRIFRNGYDKEIELLAMKTKTFFKQIRSASIEAIHKYHAWLQKENESTR